MAKKGYKKIAKTVAGAALFGVVAGCSILGVNEAGQYFLKSNTQIQTTTASTSSSSKATKSSYVTTDVSATVEKVMPSVVSITGMFTSQSYFGTQQSEGAGSGFIIAENDGKLYIATNNHVVNGGTQLTVGFCDDTTASAEIVGTDSDADLAVISVNTKDISSSTQKKISVATLDTSDDLQVGETVIAIGNALGYGQSVTTGVISAKDREVSFDDATMTLLQTDAAINPGNSGGVLVNLDGKVVGINNAKLEDTSVEGMGYAIPMTTANSILKDLMNSQSVTTENAGYMGISCQTIDSSYSQALGIPEGVYVEQVTEGSPAESAGINAGDVIVKVDGNSVSTAEGLTSKISSKTAGTKVKITVERASNSGEYKEKEITVTLGKKSDYVTEDNSAQSNSTDQGSSSQPGSADQGSSSQPGSADQGSSNQQGSVNPGSSYQDPTSQYGQSGSNSADVFSEFFGQDSNGSGSYVQ